MKTEYILAGVAVAVVAAYLYKRQQDAKAAQQGGIATRATNPMLAPVAAPPPMPRYATTNASQAFQRRAAASYV